MKWHITDAALSSFGSKTILAGAATSGAGWVVSNSFMSWIGVAIALAGLAVSVFYKIREDKRREREHRAVMRRLLRDEDEREAGRDAR